MPPMTAMLQPITHSNNSVTVKPIETRYAGHRFRSRLEARWAVLFDKLGIRWLYEHQGFETSAGPYLPDFWLPDLNTFVETKGSHCTSDELNKLQELIQDQVAFGAFGFSFSEDEFFFELFPALDFRRIFPWPGDLERPTSCDVFAPPKSALLGWDNLCCPVCGEDNVHMEPPRYLTGDYPHRHIRQRGPITSIQMWSEHCSHEWELVIAFHKGATSIELCVPHDRNYSPLWFALNSDQGKVAIAAARTARFEHGETP